METESKTKPLISFVIPSYNKEVFLREAIDSCLEQTLKEIEVIVVDDGSTDHTPRLMEYLSKKDSRIVSLRLDSNHGRSFARNYGNSKASADIICVLDADDKNVPKRAAITYDHFKRNPDTGLFYGSFAVCDYFFEVVDQIKAKPFDYEMVKKTGMTYMGHSSMAYPKKITETFKYSADEYADLGLDDWKLQMDLFHAGIKFNYTTEVLYLYRQLSDSVSLIRNATDVYKLKGKYFEEHGERLTELETV